MRYVRWLACGGIVWAIALLVADGADAQPLFGPGTWGGALEFGFDGERQQTKTEGGAGTESTRTRYEERLTVRNTGSFIVDPRLYSGNFSGTFGLFQEQSRFDGAESSPSGTLLGYSFDTSILPLTPYSALVSTSLNQAILSREFGGRSEIIAENRGGTFRLREDSILQDLGFPYFSAVLGARQELTKEDTTVLNRAFRRDEVRTVVSYDGNKGFETSDLALRYEFTDLDDRENPIANFGSHAAALTYSLDFGPTLNRRGDSRLQYLARTGRTPSTFLSADEELRIDHHETLFTNYRYLFSRSETSGLTGATTTHSGSVRLQHGLYRSLTTGLGANGMLQDFPSGRGTSYGGDAGLNYTRALPWRGQLFGGAGAGYHVNESRFTVSRLDVTEEPHTAPVPLGGGAGFTLANPFVITGTIVVVDTRGGARLPTTPGVDYLIVQEGDFTKIIPLPTSPVILPGDPLVVSYSFEVDPSLKLSTLSRRGSAGADFRWIAVSLAHEQSEQTLLSGRDGRFLEDRTVDTARLELRGDWERMQALATAEYEIQESTRLQFAAWRFTQSLSYRPVFEIGLRLNAQESFTELTHPQRRSDAYSARGDVDWLPLAGLLIAAFIEFRVFQDSQLPPETVREAGLRARWNFGKVEVAPTFTWSEREREPAETTDLRFNLRVIRRF